MLTTLTVALLLGQFPQPSCPTCGTCVWPSAPEGAHGWFPFFTDAGWERIKNTCKGEVLGLGTNKCPCPLGEPVPNGDLWALQMRGTFRAAAPAGAPAAPRTPPSAPNPTPAPNGASEPKPEPPATTGTPSLPTGPALPLP
jgi:hypothetical protein